MSCVASAPGAGGCSAWYQPFQGSSSLIGHPFTSRRRRRRTLPAVSHRAPSLTCVRPRMLAKSAPACHGSVVSSPRMRARAPASQRITASFQISGSGLRRSRGPAAERFPLSAFSMRQRPAPGVWFTTPAPAIPRAQQQATHPPGRNSKRPQQTGNTDRPGRAPQVYRRPERQQVSSAPSPGRPHHFAPGRLLFAYQAPMIHRLCLLGAHDHVRYARDAAPPGKQSLLASGAVALA